MKYPLLALALTTALAGCSSLPSVSWPFGSSKAPTVPPPRPMPAATGASSAGAGGATAPKGEADSAPFNALMADLATQLEAHTAHKQGTATYLVGSFTHLNNLSETSPLGRLIGESLIHELQVRQWRIFEPRLMQNFLINREGEFALSRDVKNLKDQFGVTAVVTGTFMQAHDQVWVNARVVDTQSGLVLTTGQVKVPSSWVGSQLATAPRVEPTPGLRIVGDRP